MKNTVILAILLLHSIMSFGQEEEHQEVFKTDSTWIKEIIKFPIGFAQEIKFEGFEDLRFPEGWSKKDSPNFWSYVWAWSLNDIKGLTENELEHNLQLYFDGLLGIGLNSKRDSKIQTTNAIFIKRETSSDNSQYVGKVNTFDTRYTNKPMTLNVLVDSYYCEQENKAIIVFRFSPKSFKNDVWVKLKEVVLIEDICDH